MYCLCYVLFLFFFFSSRRRHTRCSRDWSSDVCSSDLVAEVDSLLARERGGRRSAFEIDGAIDERVHPRLRRHLDPLDMRSEERRVGEEGRSRGSPYHLKKKKK